MGFTTINGVLTITNKGDISSINADGGVGGSIFRNISLY